MHAFGSGTKYRRCLSKCGNKGKNGYKGTGKIGKILGKILYNSELITHIVVAPANIKFGEVFGFDSSNFVHDVWYER